MPLIEGLGDEVTIVFSVLLIIVVGLLAWFSTHTSDIPFFSVVIVELSQRVNRNNGQNSNTGQNSDQNVEGSGNDNNEVPTLGIVANEAVDNISGSTSLGDAVNSALENVNTALRLDPVILDDEEDDDDDSADTENSEGVSDNTEPENLTSQTLRNDSVATDSVLPEASLLQPSDSQLSENELRKRRVAFFQDGQSESSSTQSAVSEGVSKSTSASSSNATATDSSVPISSEGQSNVNRENSQTPTGSTEPDSLQIRIRLKYLNDTQRLVLARPLDTIGVFRRTHFSEELSQQKLVRLIFNGQDLSRNESSTLQSCNIVDNSVLHCLITQNVRPAQRHENETEDDVNIGNFIIPIFGLLLAMLWYLRYNYKQYFNAISTLSLAGISFLFAFAAFTSWRSTHTANRENRHLE